jgi:hypothetical protein
MMMSASPCLKYSRPRFASNCPSQQSAQTSPVISDAFLPFINRDNQNELASLKWLSYSRQPSPVQRCSFNHILWPTDAVFFTPYDTIETRPLDHARGTISTRVPGGFGLSGLTALSLAEGP